MLFAIDNSFLVCCILLCKNIVFWPKMFIFAVCKYDRNA